MTDWDAGGWPGAQRVQEDAFLALTPEQRLAWLEEAIAFARTAIAASEKAVDLGLAMGGYPEQGTVPAVGHLGPDQSSSSSSSAMPPA